MKFLLNHSPSPPAPSEQRRTALYICFYLAGLTWLVFGQTLRFPYINFDDSQYVFQNPEVLKGISLQGIAWAFSNQVLYLWTPLTTVSHMLDCQLFGLAPAGHHLTNVVLHMASVILLFLTLRRMTGALWRSAFVAAVFAIHPLRVESVAWVAERKDVLCGFFFMATLAVYVRYTRAPSLGMYAAIAFLFTLGLLAKPMLVTLPFVLLLLDFWPLERWDAGFGRLVGEKLPLFALSAAWALMTFFGVGKPGPPQHLPPSHLATRLANAPVAAVTYLWEMVNPTGLALLYPFPKNGQPAWAATLALCALALASAGVWFSRKKRPFLVVGWFWYLGMLVPVAGIIRMGGESHADRYTYLPQIGIYILVTWAIAEWALKLRHGREILGMAAAAVLVTLTLCARAQAGYWRNSETLWLRTLAMTSGNVLPYINLGGALLDQGRVDEAISQFQKALAMNPTLAGVHLNLGNAFLKKGELDMAAAEYRKAMQFQPHYAEAEYSLAGVLLQKGAAGEAADLYEEAIADRPDYTEACNNLAHILATSRDPGVRNGRRAQELAAEANRLTDGANPVVLSTLAAAYAESGRFPEAIETVGKALPLAAAQGNAALVALLQSEMRSYEAGAPWRSGP